MIQTEPMMFRAGYDCPATVAHFAAGSSRCDASDKGIPSSLKDAGAEGPYSRQDGGSMSDQQLDDFTRAHERRAEELIQQRAREKAKAI